MHLEGEADDLVHLKEGGLDYLALDVLVGLIQYCMSEVKVCWMS